MLLIEESSSCWEVYEPGSCVGMLQAFLITSMRIFSNARRYTSTDLVLGSSSFVLTSSISNLLSLHPE